MKSLIQKIITKKFLAEVGGILFLIFIVFGWFQPEGYWWFLGLNPYDLIDKIFSFVMGIFFK